MEKEGIVEAEHVWDRLHSLWWACVKERNRLATEKLERARVDAGYGDHENKHRDETVCICATCQSYNLITAVSGPKNHEGDIGCHG
jgi:hypothetical protein